MPKTPRSMLVVTRALLSLGCVLALPVGVAAADTPSALKAILEVDREAYYTGDPVPVRISIWNDGPTSIEAPAGEIPAGFELYDVDGKKVAPVPEPSPAAPAAEARPAAEADSSERAGTATRRLSAGAFVGYARDLTSRFPRLKEAGTYRLQWSSGGLVSNAVILRVLPRYDPEKDYQARVETDMGNFTIEFLRKDAPIAVKTFIDLAQTGFYDGIVFHRVEPDRLVVSGDPTGTGQGGPGFHIPHERTQAKMVAGTVVLAATGRPPTNGSIFAILLAPRPEFEGTSTAFAQVVDGLDVVRRISEVPASPKNAPLANRPMQDVKINRVVIRPKSAA